MTAAAVLAAAALAASGSQPPAPSTATAAALLEPGRQEVLVEMWKRRILERGADRFSPEDMAELERLRQAERLGALELLREQLGSVRGWAVEHKVGRIRRLWLTRKGHQQYVFVKSQLARKYFETRGTDAKWVFRLKTTDGKRLFDGQGLLTPDGDALYSRILRGEAVQWKESGGRVESSVRPGKR